MSEPFGRKHQQDRTVNPPTIISTRKKGERFTIIRKKLAEDKTLSWEARGMLLYLLGKPKNWKVRVTDLVNKGTAKTHTVRKILNELRKAGYVHFYQPEKIGKFGEGTWFVSDNPLFLSGSPRCVIPHAVLQHHTKEGVSTKSQKKLGWKTGPSPVERDPELPVFAAKGMEPHDPSEPLPPIEHNRFGPNITATDFEEEIPF